MNNSKTENDRVVKLSVLVAVYNVRKWLHKCLSSLADQDFVDAEFILVDDASTDGSSAICDEYATHDARFRVIHLAENGGTLRARTRAIREARGHWVTFMDGDDYLPSTKCLSQLIALAQRENVDILNFDVQIDTDCSENERLMLKWLGDKVIDTIEGGAPLARRIFCLHERSWNLWSKIYRREVLVQASAHYPNVYSTWIEDAVQFFLVTWFARTYKAVRTIPFYCYRFGSGITVNRICSDQFGRHASEMSILHWITDFLLAHNSQEEFLEPLESLTQNLLSDIMRRYDELQPEEKPQAFDHLNQHISPVRLVPYLWRRYGNVAGHFAKSIGSAKCLAKSMRHVHTVGILCTNLSSDVGRIITLQIPEMLRLSYRIVLLTEQTDSKCEYSVPVEVIQVPVPIGCCTERARALSEIFSKHRIDLLIHHAASTPAALFDILMAKLSGLAVVVERHELTSQNLYWNDITSLRMPDILSLSDRLLVQSHMEESFYRSMGIQTRYLPHPIVLRTPLENKSENTLLWIDRLEDCQKDFTGALEIMRRVCQIRPSTRCYIVGSAQTLEVAEKVHNFIRENGLTESVIWTEQSEGIDGYYHKASVHLVTSRYESFPMMIAESKSRGVPVVCYEMPYLELLRSGLGHICVPQGDVQAAAEAVVSILENEKTRKRLSKEGRTSIEPFAKFDQVVAWQSLIRSIEEGTPEVSETPQTRYFRLFWTTMAAHIEHGHLCSDLQARQQDAQISELNRRLAEVQREVAQLKDRFSPERGIFVESQEGRLLLILPKIFLKCTVYKILRWFCFGGIRARIVMRHEMWQDRYETAQRLRKQLNRG